MTRVTALLCVGALSAAVNVLAQAPPVVLQQTPVVPVQPPLAAPLAAASGAFPATARVAFVDLQRIANESDLASLMPGLDISTEVIARLNARK